jgi:hypothetical protein
LTVFNLGLDHAGGHLMHQVTDLELGDAEELRVGLGGKQLGHLAEFRFSCLEGRASAH